MASLDLHVNSEVYYIRHDIYFYEALFWMYEKVYGIESDSRHLKHYSYTVADN